MFPQYKVDEQPNKRLKKGSKKEKVKTKGAVAIAKSVSQLGCVSQDSDALASQGTKEFRENPRKVLNVIQRVRSLSPRYVTRVSGTRRDHRLEKHKSNLDISGVPTLWNSRIGPTKRLKDKSDVPKARLGILQKYIYIYNLKANDKATFFSPAEQWVLPSASAREPEERDRVCG